MSHPSENIPLRILLCDPDGSAARSLEYELKHRKEVQEVTLEKSLDSARRTLRSNDINTLIIDPLGFDLDAASGFVFDVRRTLPEIVCVLYIDKATTEKR